MQTESVVIHVRFAPNGTVMEIGERPSAVGAQEWFNHLSKNTLNCYQTLSGGRGVFRLPKELLSTAKAPWNNGKGAVL